MVVLFSRFLSDPPKSEEEEKKKSQSSAKITGQLVKTFQGFFFRKQPPTHFLKNKNNFSLVRFEIKSLFLYFFAFFFPALLFFLEKKSTLENKGRPDGQQQVLCLKKEKKKIY